MPTVSPCPVVARDAAGLQLPGGATLAVFSEQMLASSTAFSRLTLRLAELRDRGLPVALRVYGSEMLRFCGALGEALVRAGVDAERVDLSVGWHDIAPDAALRLRSGTLGPGRLHIVLSDLQAVAADDRWERLWRLRAEPLVSVCCWPVLSSPSALLAPELADDALPELALQVPARSAWVLQWLNLCDYLDASGSLDEARLQQALSSAVDAADAAHDEIRWPLVAMQHDSWFNRRIAIGLTGIGDFARQSGLDPSRHVTLRRLDALLGRVGASLRRASQRLAAGSELLPAIANNDPSRRIPAGAASAAWRQRWQRALERDALRHRNLLVLSPWDLFPGNTADYRYADLCPLLGHADACWFRRGPALHHWKPHEFKHFHARILAVMQARAARAAVAERL